MKIKPYTLVRVSDPAGYDYTGEAMSFETPENTAMVRRVPGHPGTLTEIPVSWLTESHLNAKSRLWVHYATVSGRSSFPIDMLRYDHCAPLNFIFNESAQCPGYTTASAPDESFGWPDLVVACLSDKADAYYAWTPARWSSFLWGIKELKTIPYTRGE